MTIRCLHDPIWIAAGADPLDPYEQWIRLIDLARSSYFALAKKDPSRAAAILQRWSESDETTCKRLLLHALAEDEASEADMAHAVLLQGEAPGIWDPDLRNEVLRFLNKAGSRLRPGLVNRIAEAIHAGPGAATSDQLGIDPDGLDRAKVARLLELHLSGTKLDRDSLRLVVERIRPVGGRLRRIPWSALRKQGRDCWRRRSARPRSPQRSLGRPTTGVVWRARRTEMGGSRRPRARRRREGR